MQSEQVQQLNTLHMHQRLTLMVNRYEFRADDGSGDAGALVAFAEQRRAKLKEQVTLFTDESKQQVLTAFNARKVIDLGSGYDVTDPAGERLGTFRKDFGKSLLRSTWHLEQSSGAAITGQERSMTIAVLRRLWEFIPFIEVIPFFVPYHFDFAADADHVLSVRKKGVIRDRYVITIHDPALDRRLVMAQAVALDALQSR